jgi:hypothetical protein
LQHAEFAPPVPEQAGDFIAGKLLRNGARLGLRNGQAPFATSVVSRCARAPTSSCPS